MQTPIIDQESNSCINGCFSGFQTGTVSPTLIRTQFLERSDGGEDEFVNMKDPSRLLAEEMNNLSLQEREKVYEDIHGVRDSIKETNELLISSLNQLDVEISRTSRKPAYGTAAQMSNEFVTNPKFRLMFLRSTRFDAAKAAHKLVNYFEMKLQLFGREKLTKKITLSDLDQENLNCLTGGCAQLLPFRDRVGRAVLFFFSKKMYDHKTADNMLRAGYYLMMSVMEDEETQRAGIVTVVYCLEKRELQDKFDFSALKGLAKMTNCLPYRRYCLHFCFHRSMLFTFASLVMNDLASFSRSRVRIHEGSQTECCFSLLTFGIPVHVLPMTNDGKLRIDNHLKWLQRRKIIETNYSFGKFFRGVDLPSRFDILLGRGRPIQNHMGNVSLRRLINDYKAIYETSERVAKKDLTARIVQFVKQSNGRFLKQDKNGYWFEVSDEISRVKVASGFRTVISENTATAKSSPCSVKRLKSS